MAITDPLLRCLEILCKLNGRHFSEQEAKAGLPLVENRLTPAIFVRAAQQLGFTASVQEITLSKIKLSDYPVVLILKNNDACVLTKKIDQSRYEVYSSEKAGAQEIDAKTLEDKYGGYAVLTEAEFDLKSRPNEYNPIEAKSWFWDTFWSCRDIYAHVLIAAFLTNLFVLVSPLFIMNVYDRVVPNDAIATLWVLSLGALIFFIFDLFARLLRHHLIDVAARRADLQLSARLFKHFMGLRLAHKPQSIGTVSFYFNEFESLREFITSATFVGLIDIPFIILFLVVIYFIGGSLVLVPLIAVPIILVFAMLCEVPARKAVQEAFAGVAFKSSVLVESILGLEEIKSMVAESQVQSKWEHSVDKTEQAATISRFYSALTMNFTVWIQQLVVIGVIVYGVYLISANELTIGGLIACTILSGRSVMLGQVAGLLNRVERSRVSLKGLNKIMSIPTDRTIRERFIHRPIIKGDINVDRVVFKYPDYQTKALDDISFNIKAGEKVGIIGKIGSGKTTLLKLIVGFYEPTDGTIRVDGTESLEIDPYDLRRNIHYISGDSMLFFGSVRDNIMMANPGASDEEFIKAVTLAGVDKFTSRHPQGFDMPVGERGDLLSSGQKQAVALARSLIVNAPVYLLDEPTGLVDNTYEKEFIAAMKSTLGNKTLLIVTHRAPMLALVDRVIVLDRGKIIADGPRDEILSQLGKSASSAGY